MKKREEEFFFPERIKELSKRKEKKKGKEGIRKLVKKEDKKKKPKYKERNNKERNTINNNTTKEMLGEEDSKVITPDEIKAKFANCGDTLKLWGIKKYLLFTILFSYFAVHFI